MTRSVLPTITLLTVLGATTLSAEAPDLATVLEGHATAVGCDAAAEIDTLHLEGTYVYNSGEGAAEIWLDRPGRVHLAIDGGQRETTDFGVWDTIDAEPGSLFIRVLDGEDGWFLSQANDETGELEDIDRAVLFDLLEVGGPLCDTSRKGHQALLEGIAPIEGQEAIHLTLALADGRTESWYLDPESFLPIRREVPLGEDSKFYAPGVWTFDDYRSVGGVRIPFYTMAEESIFSRELILDRVEAGVEVPTDLFERPAAPSP